MFMCSTNTYISLYIGVSTLSKKKIPLLSIPMFELIENKYFQRLGQESDETRIVFTFNLKFFSALTLLAKSQTCILFLTETEGSCPSFWERTHNTFVRGGLENELPVGDRKR